jgi:hypothetical protein
VLIRDGETPLLIDYGAVEWAPACVDPLILELSLLFHPECRRVAAPWPSADQALAWPGLDEYIKGTRLAPFIRACRDWAFAAEPLDKGVYATAYAFAARQLKFDSVDHDLAAAVATAAHNAISTT